MRYLFLSNAISPVYRLSTHEMEFAHESKHTSEIDKSNDEI
jgi:hypothetical protein